MSLPLEQGGASVVLLVSEVQHKARFALIIVETEDGNVCLQSFLEWSDLVRYDCLLDSVHVVSQQLVLVVPWPFATPFEWHS